MKKFYQFISIVLIILFLFAMPESYAKYTFHDSAKVLQIHQLFESTSSSAIIPENSNSGTN